MIRVWRKKYSAEKNKNKYSFKHFQEHILCTRIKKVEIIHNVVFVILKTFVAATRTIKLLSTEIQKRKIIFKFRWNCCIWMPILLLMS